MKKSKKVFSNVVSIRPTVAGCTVVPIATVADITIPGHDSPFYAGETIRLAVVGEPNRPVQLCWSSAYSAASGCNPSLPSFNQKMATNGTWSKDIPLQSSMIGTWTYWFIVQGQKSNVLTYSVTPPPPAPLAPANLVARPGTWVTCGDNPSKTPIGLSWDASAGATSYTIKRSDTSGGPYTLLASGVVGTSYTDSIPVVISPEAYFVVSAVNGYGESGNSNEMSAGFIIGDCPPPPTDAPKNVTAQGSAICTQQGDRYSTQYRVQLQWNAVAGAVGYNVWRSYDGEEYTMLGNSSDTSGTVFIDEDAGSSVVYYTVSALKQRGDRVAETARSTPVQPDFPTVDCQTGQ